MKRFRLLTVAALVAGACAAGDSLPSAPPLPTSPTPPVGSEPPAAPPPPAGPTAVLVGAGDISTCKNNNDEDTARLLDRQDGVIFTAGDNAYEEGTIQEFQNCYAPTWGRHLLRTRPSPGNHEYDTPGAAGYYSYFGANAGPPGLGYYSYELAGWHIISLNSNVAARTGSPQYEWLSADLAATSATCAAAYWHHPLFSSGDHGNYSVMRAIWRLLYDHGVEIVISGHDHDYERFAPQTADGQFDSVRGIRSFVVGTGGKSLDVFKQIQPNSEVRDSSTYGVLKLTLRSNSYDWEFMPAGGGGFRDFGGGTCR